jgi:imidazoleglycerol phosphate synthase glutamine amidotransferase subunit HisH
VTTTQYGSDRFASTVRKGSILATQYHPEKSDAAGLRLLKDWVERSGVSIT